MMDDLPQAEYERELITKWWFLRADKQTSDVWNFKTFKKLNLTM